MKKKARAKKQPSSRTPRRSRGTVWIGHYGDSMKRRASEELVDWRSVLTFGDLAAIVRDAQASDVALYLVADRPLYAAAKAIFLAAGYKVRYAS